MGWIVVILILYVVIYNIREADKKEKREAEDEERRRRNEEIEKKDISAWNNGICPDCGENWITFDDVIHKKWTELWKTSGSSTIHMNEPLCECPKCGCELYSLPFDVFKDISIAYGAGASEKKQLDRQKELRKTRAAASERRNKMF